MGAVEQNVDQSGGANLGQGNQVDIGGDVGGGDVVDGDKVDARHSHGAIFDASKPIEQNYGRQATAGGAYNAGEIRTAGGNFSGRDSIFINEQGTDALLAMQHQLARIEDNLNWQIELMRRDIERNHEDVLGLCNDLELMRRDVAALRMVGLGLALAFLLFALVQKASAMGLLAVDVQLVGNYLFISYRYTIVAWLKTHFIG